MYNAASSAAMNNSPLLDGNTQQQFEVVEAVFICSELLMRIRSYGKRRSK
jgi:hypothetical protein